MIEKLLIDKEKIKLDPENVSYALEESKLPINRGVVFLTNKRFVVARRSKVWEVFMTWMLPIPVIIPIIFMTNLSMLEAALIGALAGGVIGALGHLVFKVKDKGPILPNPAVSIDLKDVSEVQEDNNILIIKSIDEEICKFVPVDKQAWLKAIAKK